MVYLDICFDHWELLDVLVHPLYLIRVKLGHTPHLELALLLHKRSKPSRIRTKGEILNFTSLLILEPPHLFGYLPVPQAYCSRSVSHCNNLIAEAEAYCCDIVPIEQAKLLNLSEGFGAENSDHIILVNN